MSDSAINPKSLKGDLLKRSSKNISIERMKLSRLDALYDFLKKAHADQPLAVVFRDEDGIRRRWKWLNQDYPIPLDNELPAWICLRNDRIVGHFGVLPVHVALQGRLIPAYWGRDLIVAPEHRQLGVGPRLVMAACDAVRHSCMVAGLNASSRTLFGRLGFEDCGKIPLFVKIRDARPFLESFSWPPSVRRVVLGMAAQTVQIVLDAQTRRRRVEHHALNVSPLECFDERFDPWWSTLEPAFPSIVRRTSSLMAWRYLAHPLHRYYIFAAKDHTSLRGILVLRHGTSRGVPAGFITEVLARPEDGESLRCLLQFSTEFFSAWQGERPVFLRCSVHHRGVQRALWQAGFWQVPSTHYWMTAPPVRYGEGIGLVPFDDWFLNGGDSDLDFV